MYQRFALLFAAAGVALAVACAQSDAGITASVKAKLVEEPTVKAYQIDVDTSDRVVTLSGTVATSAAKDAAITLARQTDGVRDVVDRLTVDPQAASAALGSDLEKVRQEIREETRQAADAATRVLQGAGDEAREAAEEARGEALKNAGEAVNQAQAVLTDAAVTSAVKATFLADTAVSGLKIDVDTDGGVVTLTGTVGTREEAARAVTLARDTSGVRRVVDRLTVSR
jgi:osmotically-inducible protein OsmY